LNLNALKRDPGERQDDVISMHAGEVMLRLLLASILLCFASGAAGAADTYPTRPIRLVAPFPAGGTADVVARTVTNEVGQQLGQPFVLDNRAGANGIIGTDTVAKAPPDGYTLLHVTASLVINPHIYRKLPYDALKDLDAVTNVVVGAGYLVLVHPSVPVSSVPELVALAKKGKLSYSSPGVGNTLHLAAELFNVRAGVKMLHVPYKGVAPAMNAVMGGEVQATFMPATISLGNVKAGKLKAVAFTGASRWSVLPDLPTVNEQGVDYELSGGWHGWFAPAKTPSAILTRLHQHVKKALQLARVREAMQTGGYEPDGRSPAESRKFVRAEYDRYGEMVRVANVPKE
jgi:tripartite-type tricarboxylate transporter receptor subunit TctC